ncbi:MAG: hypothetical protein WAU15_04950 [Nitrosomonas sp.]
MWVTIFVLALATTVALALLGPLADSWLQAATEEVRRRIQWTVLAVFWTLFLTMVIAVVPIVIKIFVWAQVRIGNGNHWLVQWLQQHEADVMWTVWGVIVVALIMAGPTILAEIRSTIP